MCTILSSCAVGEIPHEGASKVCCIYEISVELHGQGLKVLYIKIFLK